MNKRIKGYFAIAKEISKMSDFNGPHIGAVVVEGKTVISTGFNSKKTRPLQKRANIYRHFDHPEHAVPMEHAEISALSPLIGKEIDWSRVNIYVYRELKDGMRACCRPCAGCMKIIKDLGIKRIYYIDELGNFTMEKTL